jgi:uncharacterized membrane protein YkvA (DUF1232 family)
VADRITDQTSETPINRPVLATAHAVDAVTLGDRMLLSWILVAALVIVASWLVMIVLARRLPPGLAKDLATVLPACVTTARRLRRDRRVPTRVKVAVAFAGLWVLSPIDLIPEFLPVIGPLDDIVVVALALRYAARRVPPEALVDAWPADRRILSRLAPATASVVSPGPGF